MKGLDASFAHEGKPEPEKAEKPEREITGGRIITCVGEPSDYSEEDKQHFLDLDPVPVSFYGGPDRWEALGQSNAGWASYVISRIDTTNKASDSYYDCTGMVAVGTEKKTGQNLSFLTHQNPEKFLKATREEFKQDLSDRLRELNALSEPGSVDVVIFGGQQFRSHHEMYEHSIKLLQEVSEITLQIEPHVVIGPDVGGHTATKAVFDTARRRLYVVRPGQPGTGVTNTSFPASEVQKKRKEWK